MARAKRSDSIDSAVKDILDVAKGLPDLPSHVKLRAQDRPYWNSIVMNRARDDWTDTELVACAQLARTQADIAEWTERMNHEPAVIMSGSAQLTPKPNVYLRLIEEATRRELALFRMLGLSTPSGRDRILRRKKLFEQGLAGPDALPGSGRKSKTLSADDLLA